MLLILDSFVFSVQSEILSHGVSRVFLNSSMTTALLTSDMPFRFSCLTCDG